MKKTDKDTKVKKLPSKHEEKITIDLTADQFLQKTIDMADRLLKKQQADAERKKNKGKTG